MFKQTTLVGTVQPLFEDAEPHLQPTPVERGRFPAGLGKFAFGADWSLFFVKPTGALWS